MSPASQRRESDSMPSVNIGTSGWHYDHWHGPFYPDQMDAADMLSYYSRRLATVEINNSFYRLPAEETLANWRRTVPSGFLFSVKASRYITHMKKLKDFHQPLKTFLDRIGVLQNSLGPVLFQLPPNWNCNHQRLEAFVTGLPDGFRFVIEFRNPDWYNRRTFSILADGGVALCLHDMKGSETPKEITAEFVYVRFHGPQIYGGRYEKQTLAGWAGAFSSWQRQERTIYCYFNNDEEGHAVRNALELKRMLGD